MVAATAVDRLNPIAAMAHDKKRIVLSEKENMLFRRVLLMWRECSIVQWSKNQSIECAK